jgi:hypothetical protein
MEAGLYVAADREARDHCVVVIKGTFKTDSRGQMTLANTQRPLAYVDEYQADPGISCIRYGSDFVLHKPYTDVIVVGKAVAPKGEPVRQLTVRLEVQGRCKDVLVTGERRWVRVLGDIVPSKPVPFLEIPLTFDRAFGGKDDSRGPGKDSVEGRNLAGVSFHPHRPAAEIDGKPLPNLEDPKKPMKGPRDRVIPFGFGFVSPNWETRRKHAGTYDQRWKSEVFPFLPSDFDEQFFQMAPEDQRFPLFKGGEVIRCFNMATTPVVQYNIPALTHDVTFCFVDRDEQRQGVLDTVVLEPHDNLAVLVWRCSVVLGKKLNRLGEILVGPPPKSMRAVEPRAYRRGKPVFAGIGAAIRWQRSVKRPS